MTTKDLPASYCTVSWSLERCNILDLQQALDSVLLLQASPVCISTQRHVVVARGIHIICFLGILGVL